MFKCQNRCYQNKCYWQDFINCFIASENISHSVYFIISFFEKVYYSMVKKRRKKFPGVKCNIGRLLSEVIIINVQKVVMFKKYFYYFFLLLPQLEQCLRCRHSFWALASDCHVKYSNQNVTWLNSISLTVVCSSVLASNYNMKLFLLLFMVLVTVKVPWQADRSLSVNYRNVFHLIHSFHSL